MFQLAGSHRSAKVCLTEFYESCTGGHQQPQMKDLVIVFQQMIGELRNVTVVLDALDESKERRDVLRWMTSSEHERCSFVLLSRSERDIEEALDSWLPSDGIVTLEHEPTGEDFKAYIHHRLEVETNLKRMVSMHNEITDVLVAKAGGMWVPSRCSLTFEH